jgi:Raf kinase inhibitor-like YbhB/YbcL family protein
MFRTWLGIGKWIVLGLLFGLAPRSAAKEGAAMHFSSAAFSAGGSIPAKYTCQGADVSPPFEIGEIPAGAKSLALIVDDPDAPDPAAPKTTWVHWVLYNVSPSTKTFVEGMAARDLAGALEGQNDWKATGYRGPCPPIGKHRYFFKLYALDVVLPDLHKPSKAALEKAMKGHVLAKAEWMGVYQKQ